MPPDDKTKLILDLLAREITLDEAAQQACVSEQAVRNWRKQFLDGGTRNMRGDAICGHIIREQDLQKQIIELKAIIGDLYLQLKKRNSTQNGTYLSRLNGK